MLSLLQPFLMWICLFWNLYACSETVASQKSEIHPFQNIHSSNFWNGLDFDLISFQNVPKWWVGKNNDFGCLQKKAATTVHFGKFLNELSMTWRLIQDEVKSEMRWSKFVFAACLKSFEMRVWPFWAISGMDLLCRRGLTATRQDTTFKVRLPLPQE